MIEVIDPRNVLRLEDLQDRANGRTAETQSHLSTLLDRVEAIAAFTPERKAI